LKQDSPGTTSLCVAAFWALGLPGSNPSHALGLLTCEARTVKGYKLPEVPWNIPSRKCGISRPAWLSGRCKRRTVNPQVPGSSPGRGAKQIRLGHLGPMDFVPRSAIAGFILPAIPFAPCAATTPKAKRGREQYRGPERGAVVCTRSASPSAERCRRCGGPSTL